MAVIQTSLDKLIASIAIASEVAAHKVISKSAIPSDLNYPSEKLFFDTIDTLLTSRIIITSPTPSDCFLQGETQNIVWTSTDIDYVKISYSSDGGSTWHVLTASFASDGTPYPWIIPSIIASNVMIKIEDTDNPYDYCIAFCNIDILTIADSPIAETELIETICKSIFIWGTNHPADSLVYWGLTIDDVTHALPKVATPVLYHTIIEIQTRLQITIYFYVVSETAYGASVTSDIISFFSTLGGMSLTQLLESISGVMADGGIEPIELSGSINCAITNL